MSQQKHLSKIGLCKQEIQSLLHSEVAIRARLCDPELRSALCVLGDKKEKIQAKAKEAADMLAYEYEIKSERVQVARFFRAVFFPFFIGTEKPKETMKYKFGMDWDGLIFQSILDKNSVDGECIKREERELYPCQSILNSLKDLESAPSIKFKYIINGRGGDVSRDGRASYHLNKEDVLLILKRLLGFIEHACVEVQSASNNRGGSRSSELKKGFKDDVSDLLRQESEFGNIKNLALKNSKVGGHLMKLTNTLKDLESLVVESDLDKFYEAKVSESKIRNELKSQSEKLKEAEASLARHQKLLAPSQELELVAAR